MDKIETSEAVELANPSDKPSGGLLLGIAFLIVALPYWVVRLLAHALYRDVRRVGRFVRICGSTYAEARRRD